MHGAQRWPDVEGEDEDSGEAERYAGELGHAGAAPELHGLHPQQQRQAEGEDWHGVAGCRCNGGRCQLHVRIVQVQAKCVPASYLIIHA